jgi:hypothetical protein
VTIETLFAEIDSARGAWNGLIDLLSRGSADFERPRPTFANASLNEFRRRVDLAFELLYATRPVDAGDASMLVLASREADIQPQIQTLATHAESAASQLRSNWRDGATIRDGNDSFNLQLFDPAGNNYATVELGSQFKQLRAATNLLMAVLGSVVPLCKAESISDLSRRAEALGETARQADAFRHQAEQSATAANELTQRTEQAERSARDLVVQAEAVVANVRELQQKATTDSSSVTTLIEQIKTIGSAATSLEALVDGYRPKFEAFQLELDGRAKEFAQFQTDTKEAQDKNVAREAEIDRLSKLADAMISGSTTAGLANSLEKTRARYEERMNAARAGFIISVVLLAVSALPLAAHLLPGFLGDFFPKVAEGAHSSWYGVLGKVLLMVPATWLTGFYTKSFAEFFHLEREYAHKAALAMSVDGFKRQAPKYEEEITAEVFMEIRNNPGKGKDVEPAAHPLYDVLAKVVGKVAEKKDK